MGCGPDDVWAGQLFVADAVGARRIKVLSSLGITHILDLSGEEA